MCLHLKSNPNTHWFIAFSDIKVDGMKLEKVA